MHAKQTAKFHELDEGQKFVDDVSGLFLNKELAIQARKLEIDFFKNHWVCEKVPKEPWMQVISTKWLDTSKGDETSPNYRVRLVGKEIGREKRDDLFAATLPLECLKALLSLAASSQGRTEPYQVMAIDVKRAYFYAPATRLLFVRIPREDR